MNMFTKRHRRIYFTLLFLLSPGAWLLSQGIERLPIQIVRVPHTSDGVFFVKAAIPLPITAGLHSSENLYMVDEGAQVLYADATSAVPAHEMNQRIPAQFTVISRWNGTVAENDKPAKWVIAEFPLNIAQNTTNQIILKSSPTPVPKIAGLIVTETTRSIRVETGRLTAIINKSRGNLFQLLKIGNHVLVDSSDSNGFVLRDGDGIEYFTTLDDPFQTEVEKTGPLVATICIRGGFKSVQGNFLVTPDDSTTYPRLQQRFPYISYSLRYHFYVDQNYLGLDFTLENNGVYGYDSEDRWAPSQWLYFDELYLRLSIKLTQPQKTIQTESYATTLNDELLEILQDHGESYREENNNFLYRILKNGVVEQTGIRTDGWLDVHDGMIGVVAAVQHFWQNAHKKMSWEGNTLRVHFWPREGKWPFNVGTTGHEPPNVKPETYQFEGGRHKSHSVLLRFYEETQNPLKTKTLVESFNRPMFGIPHPDWIAITNALPLIAPASITSSDPEITEAINRYEQMQRARLYLQDAEPQGDLPAATLYTIMEGEVDYSSVGYGKFYGWMNFGDLFWADGYSSTHYDWTYSMLLHFLRAGKSRFLDMGEVMARHQYDVDHYWGSRRDKQDGNEIFCNGLQRYERGDHGDVTTYPYREYTPKPTHSWIGGLLLYYLMTGDRQALAASKELVEGRAKYYVVKGVFPSVGEIRYQGWTILNLLQYYNVTGEKAYYDLALRIGKEGLLAGEQMRGSRGYWGEDNDPNVQSMVMYGYVIEPLIMLHHFSKDTDILRLLERMATWLRDECLTGGSTESGKYIPYGTPTNWVREQPQTNSDPIRNLFLANLYGYLFLQTQNKTHMELARRLFRDSMFWYQAIGQPVNPMSRSAISMLPRSFPGSYTKIHGWTGRAHQIYLIAEGKLTTGIASDSNQGLIERDFYLSPSYPNPCIVKHVSSKITIPFGLIAPGHVNMEIYNIIGQRVAALVDSNYSSGHYEAYWDGRDMDDNPVVSGNYWIKMKVKDSSIWRQLQVVR